MAFPHLFIIINFFYITNKRIVSVQRVFLISKYFVLKVSAWTIVLSYHINIYRFICQHCIIPCSEFMSQIIITGIWEDGNLKPEINNNDVLVYIRKCF